LDKTNLIVGIILIVLGGVTIPGYIKDIRTKPSSFSWRYLIMGIICVVIGLIMIIEEFIKV